MVKKFYTLDDLYAYLQNHSRATHFSAKNDGDEIIVSFEAKMTFDEGEDGATEGLTPVHLKACHTLKNVNKTFISDETMTAALPSFSNRPILAYIYMDEDGNFQFRNHAKHNDEDGEIVYDEKPVGIIRENCNAHFEYDEENDKTYVVVDGYIFDEYSKAKEILEREGECSVSVEFAIRKFSYNAKEKLLVLEDIYCEGITILGVWEDGRKVNPGMVGSNIKIADFKKKNNAEFSEGRMMQILEQIESKLNELTDINSKGKEEQNVEDQNPTVVTEPVATEPETTPVEPENAVPAEPETQPENAEPEAAPVEPSAEPEEGAVEPEGTEPEATSEPEAVANFSKTFELAHDDIRTGLYGLLSAVEEANGEWYYIEKVYDDHFVYSGESGLYKQGYTKTDDAVAFAGERVHMNAEYLTDDELAIINEMRTNYAGLVEKLAQYESEPEKIALLESQDYSLIKDTDEFKELCKREAYFSLTVEEVKSKCDAMLVEEAKKIGSNYSANEPKSKYSVKPVMATKTVTKQGRYGSMFVK